jgi:hypothetical protein
MRSLGDDWKHHRHSHRSFSSAIVVIDKQGKPVEIIISKTDLVSATGKVTLNDRLTRS